MVQRVNIKNIKRNEIETISSDDRNRANHTGTQLASTISDFNIAVRSATLAGLTAVSSALISSGDSVLVALAKLQAQILNNLKVFFSNQSSPISEPKAWVGETTTSSGNWSINYSNASFTQVYGVFAQAEASGTNNADANYASVNHSTVTNTTASGRCSNAVTAGLLVATVNQASSNGTKVKVFVLDY